MLSNEERAKNKDIHKIAENTRKIAEALEYLVNNIQIMEAEEDDGDKDLGRDSTKA